MPEHKPGKVGSSGNSAIGTKFPEICGPCTHGSIGKKNLCVIVDVPAVSLSMISSKDVLAGNRMSSRIGVLFFIALRSFSLYPVTA